MRRGGPSTRSPGSQLKNSSCCAGTERVGRGRWSGPILDRLKSMTSSRRARHETFLNFEAFKIKDLTGESLRLISAPAAYVSRRSARPRLRLFMPHVQIVTPPPGPVVTRVRNSAGFGAGLPETMARAVRTRFVTLEYLTSEVCRCNARWTCVLVLSPASFKPRARPGRRRRASAQHFC